MSTVKDAPKTASTIIVRSDANARITHSRDPYFSLMRRIFQNDSSAVKGQKFLRLVEDRQLSGDPLKTIEWDAILKYLKISRVAFYAMRNRLLGLGLISIENTEYKLSGEFSRDLLDMARWWKIAILNHKEE